MNTRRFAPTSLLMALVLAAGACGDDSSSAAETVGTTAAPATTTTVAPTTTTAPTTTAGAPGATAAANFAAGSPEAAVATAYRTVFDSSLTYDAKAMFLEDAAALQPTVTAYTTVAARFGGFRLEPTAVTVNGTTASLVYDVYFGTNPQYRDQKGTASFVDGTWKVSRAEFCSFMTSARNPCPA